jgi:hypothetical protein
MTLRTCISPAGRFVYGLHRPQFRAGNYRESDALADLGEFPDGSLHRNGANFPAGPVDEPAADWIYEIPNAFPFRGATYIGRRWADERARRPETIRLPEAPEVSVFAQHLDEPTAMRAIQQLPPPLRLALALTSTDARDLCCLAHLAATFCMDPASGQPWGLAFEKGPDGRTHAKIADAGLFDAVANNRHLPDAYKVAMVLRPGVQGASEIVGEWQAPGSHVFEYLRRNSYIPWGHYAANMADDSVRYRAGDLSFEDMTGLRHLYYQRTYARLADLLGISCAVQRRRLTVAELEVLRQAVAKKLAGKASQDFDRTLWGWNYGFDYAPSGYRLHASHQQIHQQFALIPSLVASPEAEGALPAYACGDLVADVVAEFRQSTGNGFFDCYQRAIETNRRMDGTNRPARSLVVFEDSQVMLFVPKAQTSQWELQLMPKASVGNIVEADTAMRRALDRGLLVGATVLTAMGARMITTIEYSKAVVGGDDDQRLLMALMPRLPESPGAFSEAQLRWINGHYPEDFAVACRRQLPELEAS